MAYKDPAKRRAAQKAYRESPEGKAAHQRKYERRKAKRQENKEPMTLTIDPTQLAKAMRNWIATKTEGM